MCKLLFCPVFCGLWSHGQPGRALELFTSCALLYCCGRPQSRHTVNTMSEGGKNAAIFVVGAAAGAAAVFCLTKATSSGSKGKVASGNEDNKQLRRTTAVSTFRKMPMHPTDQRRHCTNDARERGDHACLAATFLRRLGAQSGSRDTRAVVPLLSYQKTEGALRGTDILLYKAQTVVS